MTANDNAPIPVGTIRVQFTAWNRWCSVYVNGKPAGYMSHYGEDTRLFLKPNAPAWLKDLEARGPWNTNKACQDAIMQAVPQVML